MERRPGPITRFRVRELRPGRYADREDTIVTEEPMEIRLGWAGRVPEPLVVTMRTPGSDFELTAGFLLSEGILSDPDQLRTISYCRAADVAAEQRYNVVSAVLASAPAHDLATRYSAVSSACGVCGKQSLDDLELRGAAPVPPGPDLDAGRMRSLPDRLTESQRVYGRTGALHAAGLFAPGGEPLVVREDVGRHNAVDKVLGWALLQGRLPLEQAVLVVSGRAGFEIVQKAVVARIPAVVAVGAPSSLAVDLARRFGQTLVGFTRPERCVVYAGEERLVDPAADGVAAANGPSS